MKKILLMLPLVAILGCESQQDRVNRFMYLQDSRTHLCYVSYGIGQNYGLLSNVPCSPEVMQAIKDDEPKVKDPMRQ